MQLMLYLTDVDETTHCFSLSPESEMLRFLIQMRSWSVVELWICMVPPGQPYSSISGFYTPLRPVLRRPNAKRCKSITGIRPSVLERRFVEYLLNCGETILTLRRVAFYSVFNNKTRDYLEHTASTGELPFEGHFGTPSRTGCQAPQAAGVNG